MSIKPLNIPQPLNEQIKNYLAESIEKKTLKIELNRQINNPVEIPLIIGGKEIKTNKTAEIRSPHDHNLVLGKYHVASQEETELAIDAALKARKTWSSMAPSERASILLKAAELLAGPYRQVLNAATMLGQSKNVYQAEIDSACELIDFWRFNPFYMQGIYDLQPTYSPQNTWNKMEYRPLEGFVFAVTPFNFTAIGGNLPTAPALMGNVVLWKPSSNAVLSAFYVMKILKESGLPDGVINLIPGKGSEIGNPVLNNPHFSGLHFTGSTSTFNGMWKKIGDNLSNGVYKYYPRIVGETGGKDFIFALPDSNKDALSTALVRGAFEYQGQKCSAASRAYIPKSIWPDIRSNLKHMISKINMGDILDFRNFMGAVIDKKSFNNITSYLNYTEKAKDANIIIGGEYDDKKGFFIKPTVIETENPKFKTMCEEIFGPVLTIFPYDDSKIDETLSLLDETSNYALTGSVFGQCREMIDKVERRLVNSAGNFYINDKPTGAVVGQQPFGGARCSGTNDKAGSYLNLLRWVSPRTIKETFVPPTDFTYPHMIEK